MMRATEEAAGLLVARAKEEAEARAEAVVEPDLDLAQKLVEQVQLHRRWIWNLSSFKDVLLFSTSSSTKNLCQRLSRLLLN
jgi:hypothetical protein